jgi:hypothetical protein
VQIIQSLARTEHRLRLTVAGSSGAERTFSCYRLDERVVIVRSPHDGSISQQDLIRTPGARVEALFAVPLLRNGPSLSVRKDFLSHSETQRSVPGRVRGDLHIIHVGHIVAQRHGLFAQRSGRRLFAAALPDVAIVVAQGPTPCCRRSQAQWRKR